ncbi:MAG: hypothetical protein ACFFD2_04200 [Promethearchaeota archaeon]
MTEKIKHKSSSSKVTMAIRVTTILIIALSILSVINIFFIYNIQLKIKSYSDDADKWTTIESVVDNDIDKIILEDMQKQQLALKLQQEMLYLNDWIKEMKEYNISYPFTFNQSDIDLIAIQAVAQIQILNDLIKGTYAFDWTNRSGGTFENDYTYEYYHTIWQSIIQVCVIDNTYVRINTSLDADLKQWLEASFFPKNPEILQVNLYEWEWELNQNITIVTQLGQFTAYYTDILDIDVTEEIPEELGWRIALYEEIIELYNDAQNAMTSALLLLTVSAVVLAFVVSVEGRANKWVSIILGTIVAIIGIYMFYIGINFYSWGNMEASMMAYF